MATLFASMLSFSLGFLAICLRSPRIVPSASVTCGLVLSAGRLPMLEARPKRARSPALHMLPRSGSCVGMGGAWLGEGRNMKVETTGLAHANRSINSLSNNYLHRGVQLPAATCGPEQRTHAADIGQRR